MHAVCEKVRRQVSAQNVSFATIFVEFFGNILFQAHAEETL